MNLAKSNSCIPKTTLEQKFCGSLHISWLVEEDLEECLLVVMETVERNARYLLNVVNVLPTGGAVAPIQSRF